MNSATQPTTGIPNSIKYARVLIAIQIFRLVGLSLIPPVQNGNLPASFAIPAGWDVLIGLTAPVVAYALGRTSLRTWGTALLWNAFGLSDLANAIALGSLTGSTSYLINNLSPIFFSVALAMVLHITTVILLLRRQTINYLRRP